MSSFLFLKNCITIKIDWTETTYDKTKKQKDEWLL